MSTTTQQNEQRILQALKDVNPKYVSDAILHYVCSQNFQERNDAKKVGDKLIIVYDSLFQLQETVA